MAADTAHILSSFNTSDIYTFLNFGIVAIAGVAISADNTTHIICTFNFA